MRDAPPFRRWRRAAPNALFVILAALAAVVLLYLARAMTFWQDEWGSIMFDGGPLDVLRPVNEHWSTIPLLMYRATFAIVGLHSYVPYIAQVIALHLISVAAAYVLVRSRGGWIVATLACIPLFFLGSGSENLFWAFQTGFVGSVAFGLWALVLLERSGRASAAGAAIVLFASVMSSGMGLFFVVAAIGRTLLDPVARPRAVAIVPPAIAYTAWYLTVGHDPVTQSGHLAGVVAVAAFVARGVGHAVGAFSGLGLVPRGNVLAVAAFGTAALATGWAVVTSRRPPALAAGALLAIVAMYTVIGVVRAELESDFATRSRYVYVAAFLLVIAVADWLPLLRDYAGGQSRGRVGLVALLSVVLVVATAANAVAFGPIRARFARNADLTRAYVELAMSTRGAGWVDPDSVLPGMPPLPILIATVERFGSPLHDDLVPAVARDPGQKAREDALLRMVGSGFRIEPGIGEATSLPLILVKVDGANGTWDDACLTLRDAGPYASATVAVPSGSRLRIAASDEGNASAVLGHLRSPSRRVDLELKKGARIDVLVPDIGDGSTWTVRLDLPDVAGTIRVCRVERR